MILNFVQRSVSIYFVGFVCGGAFERINNVKKQEIQTTYCLEEKETPLLSFLFGGWSWKFKFRNI